MYYHLFATSVYVQLASYAMNKIKTKTLYNYSISGVGKGGTAQ